MSVAEPLLNLIRNISGNTRVVGLIGWPVEHSLSPAMHNAAFKKLGLDYVYVPFPVKPGNFREAVLGLPKLGVLGVNITIPYKEEAFKIVQRIGKVTEPGNFIRAVNTLIVSKDYTLIGTNTDYRGFSKALSKAISDARVRLNGKKVVVIGAGGTARTIAYKLAWSHVQKLCLINRTESKAVKLATELRRLKSGTMVEVCEPNSDNIYQKISEASLLVNATNLGMHSGDPTPVDPSMLHKELFVFDVIYNRETELLRTARKIGAKTMGGLEMLVYQGAEALELWTHFNYTPVRAEEVVEVMRQAALEQLKVKNKRNAG